MFASDLDGTLLNKDHKMDERIYQGLQEILNQGYIFAVATGRPVPMLDAGSFPPVDFVCNNGALLLDAHQQPVRQFPISPALIGELLEEFPEMPFEFVTPDTIVTAMAPEPFLKLAKARRTKESGLIPITDEAEFLAKRQYCKNPQEICRLPVIKINCMRTFTPLDEKVDAWLKDHEDQLVNAQSMPSLYEITNAHVNKATGIRALADQYGIKEDEIAVFGDGGNDISMLKAFESFCPSSGTEQAKKSAGHIIGPADQYSVIDKMLEIVKDQGPLLR